MYLILTILKSTSKILRPSLFAFFTLLLNTLLANDSLKIIKQIEYRNYAHLGAYFSRSNTNLRIDTKVTGINIGLENDLDYSERKTTWNAAFFTQISPRITFDFSYFQVDRNSRKTLGREITIMDTTFQPSVEINSYFNDKIGSLTCQYNVFYSENARVGISLGAKILYLEMGFSATTSFGNNFDKTWAATIPAPLIGIHGQAYIKPRLLGRYKFEYFGLTVSGIRGTVIDQTISFEYFLSKNFGIGLSHVAVQYKADEMPIRQIFEGQFEYSVQGFNIFLTGRF